MVVPNHEDDCSAYTCKTTMKFTHGCMHYHHEENDTDCRLFCQLNGCT
jgi:hypothetical protein